MVFLLEVSPNKLPVLFVCVCVCFSVCVCVYVFQAAHGRALKRQRQAQAAEKSRDKNAQSGIFSETKKSTKAAKVLERAGKDSIRMATTTTSVSTSCWFC